MDLGVCVEELALRVAKIGLPAWAAATALAVAACGVPSSVVRLGRTRVLPLTIGVQGGWGPTWSLNPLSAGFLDPLWGYVLTPLAMEVPPNFGQYQPVLAATWRTSSTTVTVRLRQAARWQDGQPVTATDVVTALELEGTNGDKVWSAVTAIRARGLRTVVAQVRAGYSSAGVLNSILGASPLPAREYGKFVTPGLERTLTARWVHPASSTAKAALKQVFDRLQRYRPAKFVGDGPYRLTRAVAGAVLLTKWNGFWDSSKIHVRAIRFYPVTISTVSPPPPLSKTVDLVVGQMPTLYSRRYLAGDDTHQVGTDTFDLSVLAFDEHHYPLDLLAVRRALAEVINRKTIMALADGGSSPDRAVRYPAGIPPSVLSRWLTPAQQRSLRTYPHDLGQAARLLERAGFRRRSGRWYTPRGKRLTITVGAGSELSLPSDIGTSVAVGGALAAFGIRALDVSNGIGDVDWGLSGRDGLDPLAAVENLLGSQPLFNTADMFMPAGSLPARAQVPGLGTVTVATTIDRQAASTSSPISMRKLAMSWATYIDRQLPYLTLAESYEQILYSSARYTNWPAADSNLWKLIGLNGNYGIVNLLEHAPVRPASSNSARGKRQGRNH